MVAITVDYHAAFKNAGLDFAPLEAKGVKVTVNSTGMKFSLDGEVLASLPIAPGKISELASKFDQSNQTHLTMKASLSTVFTQLEKKLIGPAPDAGKKPAAQFFKPGEAGTAGAAQAAPEPVAVPTNIKTFPPDKMKSAPCIPLVNADQLFQPVNGTSAGSRYFVVGIGAGIKVAARYKKGASGAKLSVRIEGESFPKLTMKIQEAGVFGPTFAGTFGDKYASMHVAVDDKKQAQRVIGAVLGSMAPFIAHPCPDVQPLVAAA